MLYDKQKNRDTRKLKEVPYDLKTFTELLRNLQSEKRGRNDKKFLFAGRKNL